jgi:hypothetical protein
MPSLRRRFFRCLLLMAGALSGQLAAAPTSAQPSPPVHPSPPVDFAQVPWADGESLTYVVTWETFSAAQGTFVATQKKDHWEFRLLLASAGVVNTIYPFTGNFWSVLGAGPPWRSVEYGEERSEPKRKIKEKTVIDYAKGQASRDILLEGKTKTFSIQEPAIDDVGTMLYHIRTGPWKPGDKRTLYVYESNSEKQGEAICEAREKRAFGVWPAQPVLRISMLPTVGTHRRGHLFVWMTDDARRLPLHAELEFKYGTFDIDLVQASRTLSPAPPAPQTGHPAGKT